MVGDTTTTEVIRFLKISIVLCIIYVNGYHYVNYLLNLKAIFIEERNHFLY